MPAKRGRGSGSARASRDTSPNRPVIAAATEVQGGDGMDNPEDCGTELHMYDELLMKFKALEAEVADLRHQNDHLEKSSHQDQQLPIELHHNEPLQELLQEGSRQTDGANAAEVSAVAGAATGMPDWYPGLVATLLSELKRQPAQVSGPLPAGGSSPTSRPQSSATGASSQGPDPANLHYVFSRESIPMFRAETPASRPLKKNQEIESWIRKIENLTRSKSSSAYIQAARAHCRGLADDVINSPMFDTIDDWDEFKVKLRLKFRGTCSSTDFYRLLYEHRMTAGQAPQDFYLILQAAVFQGVRDYPDVVGDPDELIRRVFLQGLPQALRELVAVKESAPMTELADLAQRIWNARVGVKDEDGPTTISLAPSSPVHQPRSVAAAQGGPPRQPSQSSKFCTYHQLPTHDTSECRALQYPRDGRRCYNCQATDHLQYDCPFPSRQGRPVPSNPGQLRMGAKAPASSGGHREDRQTDDTADC